ncbi:MAG TPA: hypothetical protein VFE61_16230 [Candidatus Sulfotelmatobacter sp.]|nr:hypothetical protein [Candidatus Sulfotelmatobacter sp.]
MKTFTGMWMLVVLLGVASMGCAQQQDDFYLAPGYKITLAVDNSVDLSLIVLDVGGLPRQTSIDAGDWMVNGKDTSQLGPSEGQFRQGMPQTTGTYTAPHSVPKTNPVAVAFSFQPTSGSKTKETVVCNITIVERSNHFQVSRKGGAEDSFELDDRFSAPAMRNMLAHAAVAGPELMVNVGAMQPRGAGGGAKSHSNGTMVLMIAGTAPGQFNWTLPGNSATTAMLTIAGSSGAEMYSTGDCLPHGSNNCKPTPTAGYTRITSYDPKTGEVGGRFQGTVVKLDSNGRPSTYASASGSFQVTLQSLGGS